MSIKVSDYIAKRLVEYGITEIFMISGGGAMHLNDSLGNYPGLKYICNHHEQASSIAAEGYARVSGKLAVVNVTTGPGGTNTVTGLLGQWTDSVPVLYISGQVKFETTAASVPELHLRQLGDQEGNIIDIVKPLTKYAVMVKDPLDIKFILEKAIFLSTHGRPGPVWIDVPMNVQGAVIDEDKLNNYDPGIEAELFDKAKADKEAEETAVLLHNSARPVVLAGHGIRLAGAADEFIKFIEKHQLPVLSTFNGVDLIPSGHPLFMGRIGTLGSRGGNFVLQNADLVLCIGTRNNIRQISYNWQSFARAGKKVIVDIDPAELKKPTVHADIAIHCDAGYFIKKLGALLENIGVPDLRYWKEWSLARKNRYPVVLDAYGQYRKLVQPYYFIKKLTEKIPENTIIVSGNGTASVVLFQAGLVKQGQRVIWNSGCASMGYDLPAAIGACFGSGRRKEVVCLAGDGSLMMNLQELATVAYHNLPLKLFILNNSGYISIRQTQEAFFESRFVACDAKTGVGMPDFQKVAASFGLPVTVIDCHKGIEKKIETVLSRKGPVVCEVKLLPDYKFLPKLSSEKRDDGSIVSKPLEDLYPFLDREEFKSNMIVPIIEE